MSTVPRRPESIAQVLKGGKFPWNNPPKFPDVIPEEPSPLPRLRNYWPRDLPRVGFDTMHAALQRRVLQIMQALQARANPIILYGMSGAGKSTTAALIASTTNNWRFFTNRDMLANLHEARFNKDGATWRHWNGTTKNLTQNQWLDQLSRLDMLVIDDMGAEELGRDQCALLKRVLDDRSYSDKYLPTIVTTNIELVKMKDHIGYRNDSRLFQRAQPIQFEARDLRKIGLQK